MGTAEEEELLCSEFRYVLDLYEGDKDPTPYIARAIMTGKAPTIAAFIARNPYEDLRQQIVDAIKDIRDTEVN